uniref:hypothetical protein n=1 Tax=Acetatifactor sp. TaxID=1872090 RepID=UPI004056FD8C
MTENEALKRMKMCIGISPSENIVSSFKLISDVLDELQQYRAIGTVEDLKSMKENGAFTGVELAQLAAMQMKLKEYQDVGTVEEFKALKKKNEPKRADLFGDGYADGHLVYDTYKCPNCEKEYELEYEEYDFCPNCGQHIDWKAVQNEQIN